MFSSHLVFISAKEYGMQNFSEFASITYQKVAENQLYYKTLAKNGAQSKDFSERIRIILMNVFKKQLPSAASTLSIEDDLKLHLSVSALLGVLQWWLNNDLPLPPKQLAELVNNILTGLDTQVSSDAT